VTSRPTQRGGSAGAPAISATRRWGYAAGLACCVALAVLCRASFLHVPLTNDEGGYAYVARSWAAGGRLYGDAWVDRPQGLMLLFRLFVAVAPSTAGLRLCGALYAALSLLVLAYVGSRLYGRPAGLSAAALYALVSSGPQVEGFIVNGELLATLPAVAAVVLLLRARRAARPARGLFLAGLAAGGALLIKQSAIDAALIVLLFAPVGGPKPGPKGPWQGRTLQGPRQRVSPRRFLAALAGVLATPALSALWGALTGWRQYLDAVVLDNLRYRSFDAPANTLSNAMTGFGLFWSEDAALVVLALVAVAAMAGRSPVAGRRSMVRRWRARHIPNEALSYAPSLDHRPSTIDYRLRWLPLPWLAAAIVGVTLGGLYNRHYFVQLLPPLCVLAGVGLVASVQVVRRVPWTAPLLAVPLAALVMTVRADAPYYVGGSPVAISQRLYDWPVYTYQAELVAFLRRRVPAGQPFFVAYAAAPLHYLANRPSVTRYLWRRPLGTVPGAYQTALAAVERGQPVCVIPVQPVVQPPGDARMRASLARRYVVAWRRPGITVLCRKP